MQHITQKTDSVNPVSQTRVQPVFNPFEPADVNPLEGVGQLQTQPNINPLDDAKTT